MDITTIIGIVIGVGCMIFGIISGGGVVGRFIDPGSIVIVVGGTFSAIITSYSLKELLSIGKIAGQAFKEGKFDFSGSINQIIDLANVARKEGLLALEDAIKELNEPFLTKGIMLIVDGTDPELVKEILEAEIVFLGERHKTGAGLFDNMAAYAPAFGMLGTLIGLIIMLDNLDDPSSLGPGMAVALITTFYGSFVANIICTPMASKLKLRSSKEILHKQLLLEGMLSIQAGENPRIIEEKLYSLLAKGDKTTTAEAPKE
ncbi:motility protein A [Oscillospiraceae bacterium OttesenSCG-928-F05]|nr:motility protein A [Oscillospiraceae bacterium OttesenSCG-928-F05]